jgi:nitrite reductase (NADH) small subunit
MPELIRICAEKDLPREGEVCEMYEGRLCVARLNGQITVMDNICPHQEGPLGQGMIENGRVVCPYHGWAFDLKTGAELENPNEHVRIFESIVQDGSLMVRPPERPA